MAVEVIGPSGKLTIIAEITVSGCLLNIFVYTHRQMLLSLLEKTFGSEGQRLMAAQGAKNK